MTGVRRQAGRICQLALIITAAITASDHARGYSLNEQKIQFNVPVQSIDTALVAYAEQAHIQLVVSNNILKGLGESGVSGAYDPKTALEILLRNTGLEFQVTAPDTVTVRALTATK